MTVADPKELIDLLYNRSAGASVEPTTWDGDSKEFDLETEFQTMNPWVIAWVKYPASSIRDLLMGPKWRSLRYITTENVTLKSPKGSLGRTWMV